MVVFYSDMCGFVGGVFGFCLFVCFSWGYLFLEIGIVLLVGGFYASLYCVFYVIKFKLNLFV